MLQKWRLNADRNLVEIDIATYAEVTNEESFLDGFIFARGQGWNQRFLVGYRLEKDNYKALSQEQYLEWSNRANKVLRDVSGDKFFTVGAPQLLSGALYNAQYMTTMHNAEAVVRIVEHRHSPAAQDKFGLRLESFGSLHANLADSILVTAYDLDTADTIFTREIPIVLPIVRSHWRRELDKLRGHLEAIGCPYVSVAPIMQSNYLNQRIFNETPCIRITLGGVTSLDKDAEDGLPFENLSQLPAEKQLWRSEGERLQRDAETFKGYCGQQLGLDIKTIGASGQFALIRGRWFPTILILMRHARTVEGLPIDWPPDSALIDDAVESAALQCGRRWARWTCGGVAEENEEVDVEALHQRALGGELAAQVQLAHILYRGEAVERDLSTSLQWFRKAALGGDSGSQAMVAFMLDNGLGCAQNEVEGLHWHRLAAENGVDSL
jgi:hypothetical protein